MENYFLLLELSFDPPENDTEKILEAISQKHKEWTRSMADTVRRIRYIEYSTHLEDIKKTMLDPVARKQEAERAKQIKKESVAELHNILRLYRAKTAALSERDLKHLTARFGKLGFTIEEIKDEFSRTF